MRCMQKDSRGAVLSCLRNVTSLGSLLDRDMSVDLPPLLPTRILAIYVCALHVRACTVVSICLYSTFVDARAPGTPTLVRSPILPVIPALPEA